MNAIVKELKSAAMQSPRIYFAPLIGALKAVKVELTRIQNKTTTNRGNK